MLTKGPHGLGKVVPSASRDRERSRRRARSTQAPADAAPDDTSEVGFWTANYAERLRSNIFLKQRKYPIPNRFGQRADPVDTQQVGMSDLVLAIQQRLIVSRQVV